MDGSVCEDGDVEDPSRMTSASVGNSVESKCCQDDDPQGVKSQSRDDNCCEGGEPPRKKVHKQENGGGSVSGIEMTSFKGFKTVRVLNCSEDKKFIAVESHIEGQKERAVVLLEKIPFSSEKLAVIFSEATTLDTIFHNDIYRNQTAHLPPEQNIARVTTIFPATAKHIRKYEKHDSSFIEETPELYSDVTLPFITSASFDKQWIYNILDHKKESERILYEDPDPLLGFILIPDLKWTGEQMSNLYLQAIVMRRDLASIRDLTAEHIPLLKNVYDKGKVAIQEKYGISSHKLRVYLHYQPSYYHLHIHFTVLSFEAPGTWAGKAHLITSVISNLELMSDYYQRVTLPYTLSDIHPLTERFKDYGYFNKSVGSPSTG